jgi:hypothetical protein
MMFTKRTTTACLGAALAIGLLVPAGISQLSTQDRADLTAIFKIKDEGINHSQVMETLSYLTDVHGPRLSGSSGIRGAQAWAQDQLKKWGLENVGTHKYAFGRGWDLKHFSAHMVDPQYAPLIAYPKAWTPGIPGGTVKAGTVLVDIQNEADLDKYKGKLKGLYVLTKPVQAVEAHFKPQGTRYTDAELAELSTEEIRAPFNLAAGGRGGRGGAPGQPAGGRGGAQALARRVNEFYIAEGVVATIEPGRGDDGTVFVASGGDRAKDAPAVPSQVVVASEQYNRMVRIIEKNIPVTMEVNFEAEYTNPDGFEYNVTGEIPGTDKKDELVMVGGHFDSWHAGTGATDNGAGSAVAMEVMRIIKASGLKPRRTIRIGLWSGEEEGLLGSRAYVSDTFASRPAPAGGGPGGGGGGGRGGNQGPITPHEPAYSKFAGYFNIDNGTGKIRGVYLQGNEEVRPIFEAWLVPFKDMGATTLTIRNTSGTDHLSYDGVGLPGFQFIQDEIEYSSRTHHSNQDVYDRVQRGDMIQIAVIEASFVYHAAMREQKLPRKPMPAPAAGQGGGAGR